jgi:hypothetical protein
VTYPTQLIMAMRRTVDVDGNVQEWDVLRCGHRLPVTGGSEDRRPCTSCPPTAVEPKDART